MATTAGQTACPSAVESSSSSSSSSPPSPAAAKEVPQEEVNTQEQKVDTTCSMIRTKDEESGGAAAARENNGRNNCNNSPPSCALMVVPEENANQSTAAGTSDEMAATITHPMLVSFSSFSSDTKLPLLPFQQCAPEEVWSVLSTRSTRRHHHGNKKKSSSKKRKAKDKDNYSPLPCLCGNHTECNGISAAFYLLHDARSGYTPLPQSPPVVVVSNDDTTTELSQYELHVQQLRESYLRNLLPNDSLDEHNNTTTGYIANHHFHPTIVSRGVLPMFISKEDLVYLEVERPSWCDYACTTTTTPAEILSQHDQVLDEHGQHTGDYFVVPNYKLEQTKQDLTRLLKIARKVLTMQKSSGQDANVDIISPDKQQQQVEQTEEEENISNVFEKENSEKQHHVTKMELNDPNANCVSSSFTAPRDAPVDTTTSNKTCCEMEVSEFESKRKSALDSLIFSCVTQWRSCLKAAGFNVDGTTTTTTLSSSTLVAITQHAFDDVIHALLCDNTIVSSMEDSSSNRKEHTKMTFLIVCRHVFAEWFRNKDSCCAELFGQDSQSQLEDQKRNNNAERLGEALMAEIKWAEARVKNTWDAYNAAAAIGDGDSAANSVASMSESGDDSSSPPPPADDDDEPTSNLELVEMMRYRSAVGYQVLAWNRALAELTKLMECVTNTDNNAQCELLLDFVREQRRLRLNTTTIVTTTST